MTATTAMSRARGRRRRRPARRRRAAPTRRRRATRPAALWARRRRRARSGRSGGAARSRRAARPQRRRRRRARSGRAARSLPLGMARMRRWLRLRVSRVLRLAWAQQPHLLLSYMLPGVGLHAAQPPSALLAACRLVALLELPWLWPPAAVEEPSESDAKPAAAAAPAVPKREKKLQRLFLDTEAELRCVCVCLHWGSPVIRHPVWRWLHITCVCGLPSCYLPLPAAHPLPPTPTSGGCSDEEEGAGAVSDDEEDDLDDQGELVRGRRGAGGAAHVWSCRWLLDPRPPAAPCLPPALPLLPRLLPRFRNPCPAPFPSFSPFLLFPLPPRPT